MVLHLDRCLLVLIVCGCAVLSRARVPSCHVWVYLSRLVVRADLGWCRRGMYTHIAHPIRSAPQYWFAHVIRKSAWVYCGGSGEDRGDARELGWVKVWLEHWRWIRPRAPHGIHSGTWGAQRACHRRFVRLCLRSPSLVASARRVACPDRGDGRVTVGCKKRLMMRLWAAEGCK
ncbi:hypothetical protein BD779DRAFT_1478997 [Infundibulicybe gibba]|nr:hypothetical protein BD779DRAFT_1478997 [Infundibulicybe gibba]